MTDESVTTTRRLGEGISRKSAEQACSRFSKGACVSDAIAMGDLDMSAIAYRARDATEMSVASMQIY